MHLVDDHKIHIIDPTIEPTNECHHAGDLYGRWASRMARGYNSVLDAHRRECRADLLDDLLPVGKDQNPLLAPHRLGRNVGEDDSLSATCRQYEQHSASAAAERAADLLDARGLIAAQGRRQWPGLMCAALA
jgi:hypothetical protein